MGLLGDGIQSAPCLRRLRSFASSIVTLSGSLGLRQRSASPTQFCVADSCPTTPVFVGGLADFAGRALDNVTRTRTKPVSRGDVYVSGLPRLAVDDVDAHRAPAQPHV